MRIAGSKRHLFAEPWGNVTYCCCTTGAGLSVATEVVDVQASRWFLERGVGDLTEDVALEQGFGRKSFRYFESDEAEKTFQVKVKGRMAGLGLQWFFGRAGL